MKPENRWDQYHAHLYFDADTEQQAQSLCVEAWRQCHVGLGRFHKKPVGPHPLWSCQFSFDADEFERFIPWLETHRQDLSVLVHPLTGDPLAEHTEHARWLGNAVVLDVSIFESA